MSKKQHESTAFSPYITFGREEWATLRDATPMPLTETDLVRLRGLNEQISLQEVSDIYLPLSRLLNLYVGSTQNLYQVTHTFLGNSTAKVPYIIGIAGSVAVGKSTTARVVQELMARWPNHPKVDLVTTDGFLYPNRVLEQRGIMKRKGFPESYDVRKLIQFVADVKSGKPEVHAPVYSHLAYDILHNEVQVIRQPDIIIIEGLNVLQTTVAAKQKSRVFVSDFFDFSIYVDATVKHIKNWYIQRFQTLRSTAFQNEQSYFHRYATLTDNEAVQVAGTIWDEINEPNLRENIAPTKLRAHLILDKGEDHSIQSVKLRKL